MDLSGHVQRLLNSYRHWTGQELIARSGDPDGDVRALNASRVIIVSHGTEADPILNYGNRAALELWEMDFAQLASMPSRLTAEPMHRDERAQFMSRVKTEGFLRGYKGIRISRTGKRFMIEDAVIWNVLDESGAVIGQAAAFSKWAPV